MAPASKATDALKSLHTLLLDAQDGYSVGCRLAGTPEMQALFADFRDLHADHAAVLETALQARGDAAGDGSLMAVIHKAVLTIRAAVTGLEEDALPAIRDGEKRHVEAYDETIAALAGDTALRETLIRQRAVLANRVADLARLDPATESTAANHLS